MVYGTSYPAGGSFNIPPGGFAVLQLTITPEPSTQCSYEISVGTTSSAIRILEHKVTFVGGNFVCDDTATWLETEGTTIPGDGIISIYDKSEFTLNVVTSSSKTIFVLRYLVASR